MKNNKCKSTLQWIMSESQSATRYLILLTIIILMITVTNLTSALGLSQLIDSAVGAISTPLYLIIIFTILSVLLNNIFYSFRGIYISKSQEKISLAIKKQLMIHYQKVPQKQIDSYKTGDLYERLITDTDNVASFIPSNVLPIVGGVMSMIVSLIYIISVNWVFAVFIIVLSPLFMVIGQLFMPKIEKKFKALRDSQTALTSITQESINNIASNKTLCAEHYVTDMFTNKLQEKIFTKIKHDTISAIFSGLCAIVGWGTQIGIACIGSYFISIDKVSVGELMASMQMINYIVWPFTDLAGLVGSFGAKKVSASRILEVLNLKEEKVQNIPTTKYQFEQFKIENIKFSYNEGVEVLNNISLDIEPKEVVGIIGKSGSGKSTLLKMMVGLYLPEQGDIKVYSSTNDVITRYDIRNYVSYVPQSVDIRNVSIKENISFGININEEKIIKVAKLANLDGVIKKLSNGYDTVIDMQNNSLSGGELQRLGVARALYRDTPMLILDEPTSALDDQTQELMKDTICSISKNTAVVIVTHDKSVLDICNKVFLLQQGTLSKVTSVGTLIDEYI